MKFARGLVVASLVSACVPLAVACGSAANSDLFSPAGGASGSAHAGSGSANAGANTAGGAEDGTSGANNGAAGNASTGDAGDGNNGASGAPAGGKNGSGESGAPGAGASGGPMTGAGAGGAPGAGAGGGPGAGAGGTPGAGAGGAPGAGAGGAPAGGASSCPASSPKDGLVCAVSTPDSCFYSGSACSCLSNNSPSKKWGCYGTANACPDAKPAPGTSCKHRRGLPVPESRLLRLPRQLPRSQVGVSDGAGDLPGSETNAGYGVCSGSSVPVR